MRDRLYEKEREDRKIEVAWEKVYYILEDLIYSEVPFDRMIDNVIQSDAGQYLELDRNEVANYFLDMVREKISRKGEIV